MIDSESVLTQPWLQQQAKIGLAVSIEAAGEELMQQQEQAGGNIAPPAVPF